MLNIYSDNHKTDINFERSHRSDPGIILYLECSLLNIYLLYTSLLFFLFSNESPMQLQDARAELPREWSNWERRHKYSSPSLYLPFRHFWALYNTELYTEEACRAMPL